MKIKLGNSAEYVKKVNQVNGDISIIAPDQPKKYTLWEKWRAKRRQLRKHPACVICKRKPKWYQRKNDVHEYLDEAHILEDWKEGVYADGNLTTLCRVDHFVFGHNHDWGTHNNSLRHTVWQGDLQGEKTEFDVAFDEAQTKADAKKLGRVLREKLGRVLRGLRKH